MRAHGRQVGRASRRDGGQGARGGVTPWLAPAEFANLGFNMILYPTTVLFRLVRSTTQALLELKAGRPLDPKASADMEEFEALIDLPAWAEIERRFTPK
jgi:2-methylisocitrate lyase-like PEP mutase family enzyme